MNWLNNFIAGLTSLLQKRRVESELDEELESYLEASVADKKNHGMSAEAARRSALIDLGSRNAVKHRVWSSRWESSVDSLLQDVRLSFRSLRKSPGYTAIALLSLGLGIGGNTASFTLINQVLLRDLPVRNPEQLVTFDKSENGGILGGIDLGSYGMFTWNFARQLEADPGPFQGIASYGSFSGKVSVRVPAVGSNQASNYKAILSSANLVSGNYFQVLRAKSLLGRTIIPTDDATPGSGAVVVLSHHFWQQSMSSDPAVLGKTININGSPFAVIGVMPENFQGIKLELEPTAMWTPTSMQSVILQHFSFLTPESGIYFLHLFGRLSPSAAKNKVNFAQSQNWLDQQIRAAVRAKEGVSIPPARQQEINRLTVPLVRANHGVSTVRSKYGDSLQILMAVVVLVLLIACANLANFLLARATSRQREISTRLALGSSRARIVRQSLIETFLLSLAGGVLGLAIAFAVTRAFISLIGRGSGSLSLNPTPDLTVLLFTLGVSLFTGLLFGLAPAIAAARTGAARTLSSNTRTVQSSGGRFSGLWPKILVTAQVMLSLLLLVGAGLFLRTLRNLQNQDYGFERTHLVVANLNAKLAGYKPSQTAALHQQIVERVSALPGVRSVALAVTPPIGDSTWTSTIRIPGYTPGPKENMVSILNRVSGQYFETAGIAIVAGRPIGPEDSATSLKVAVINETLAKHFFPKGDALGRSLTIDIDSVKGPFRIAGIARDTKSGNPRDTEPVRMTYIALAQIEPFMPVNPPAAAAGSAAPPVAPAENDDRFADTILVRTTGDPEKTIADLRAAIAGIDANLPLLNVVTIQEQIDGLMAQDKLISALTGLFALLALLLAAIGLYGVMNYNVVRRTNEIGIRLALGAQTPTVLWMILRESLVLLGIGVAVGLPLALASTVVVKNQLFGLSQVDPATFAGAIAVVSGMTVFAAWLPARRATRVDPMEALRCD